MTKLNEFTLHHQSNTSTRYDFINENDVGIFLHCTHSALTWDFFFISIQFSDLSVKRTRSVQRLIKIPTIRQTNRHGIFYWRAGSIRTWNVIHLLNRAHGFLRLRVTNVSSLHLQSLSCFSFA